MDVIRWGSRRASQYPAVLSPVYISGRRSTNLTRSPVLVGPCRMKIYRGQISLIPFRNLPARAFDSCARGFSTPLARRRPSRPPPSPNLVRTYLIERYQALHDSAPCLIYCVQLPPEGHQIGAQKGHAPGKHHPQPILPPPRLNRSAESQRQTVDCISRG